MKPLTEQAHDAVREVVATGEIAIDATAGNGYDTRFLAELVGPTGRVYAIDLQREALDRTRELLERLGLTNVTLIHGSHADLFDVIPVTMHGYIAAVMLNLGYLPGGQKTLVTQTPSTLSAIRAGLELLRPSGVLTVVGYVGHAGGGSETAAVEQLFSHLPAREFEVTADRGGLASSAPRLFVAHKR